MEKEIKENKKNKTPKPEDFNDEIALKTKWDLLAPKSKSFSQKKLEQKNEYELIVGSTIVERIIPIIIFIIGLAIITYSFSEGSQEITGYLIGLGFLGIGYFMLKSAFKRKTFDKNNNEFTNDNPVKDNFIKDREVVCRLDEIHAVQLLKNRTGDCYSSVVIDEINLVLKDASRIHVASQVESITKAGKILSDFLKVPLWDVMPKYLSGNLGGGNMEVDGNFEYVKSRLQSDQKKNKNTD